MNFSDSTLQTIKSLIGEEHFLENESLAKHTTFRVGGPARYFIQAGADVDAVCRLLAYLDAEEISYVILGRGSNLLVSDEGYDGLIIDLSAGLTKIVVEGNRIHAQAGATLAALAHVAYEHALGGLEFAAGIPGSVGGAVTMNAGAYGGEMKDVIVDVSAYHKGANGAKVVYQNDEMDFSYRHSRVILGEDIVLGATFVLSPKEPEEIKALTEELRKKRLEKQPLQYPSAGSTFKRPEGYFAGKLIEDAGLRGYRVGGAQVSEKHCGFVINYEQASAADIWQVCKDVRRIVWERFGVKLEPEIRTLGEFSPLDA